MQIDRSNYEIWLIDWLDGNLTDSEVERLQFFLKENPDLKEEFDETANLRLDPSEKLFPHKDNLKKTIANLSESQFEYLCVAFLENDLTAGQQSEFKESIEHDKKSKPVFEFIQKMKLSPVGIPYKHKNRLLRRTAAQKVIQFSLAGLSAAAILAFVLINYLSVPRALPVRSEKSAQNIVADSNIQEPIVEKVVVEMKPVNENITQEKQDNNQIVISEKSSASLSGSGLSQDSLKIFDDFPRMTLKKIPVPAKVDLNSGPTQNSLIAFNSPVVVQEYDDGRSKLSKFLAKTFRERLLKENEAKDSPLKVYEIAEAGVSGLNKLFGWEMELDKRNDENGELKSVYFSSKMLKFNAPVKKSEAVQ